MIHDEKNRVRAYQERQQKKYDLITLCLVIALIVTLELLRR